MDQGGTFTDVVRRAMDGRVEIRKELSATIALEEWADRGADLRRGTTVATNALLEGNGVPTLLITTEGFGDIPWIGDQTRPELFELEIRRPEPLCNTVLEINNGSMFGAVVEPHHMEEADLQPWRDAGLSVAIVLVHGTLTDEEKRWERCEAWVSPKFRWGMKWRPLVGFGPGRNHFGGSALVHCPACPPLHAPDSGWLGKTVLVAKMERMPCGSIRSGWRSHCNRCARS